MSVLGYGEVLFNDHEISYESLRAGLVAELGQEEGAQRAERLAERRRVQDDRLLDALLERLLERLEDDDPKTWLLLERLAMHARTLDWPEVQLSLSRLTCEGSLWRKGPNGELERLDISDDSETGGAPAAS